jgi:hypothetical protein
VPPGAAAPAANVAPETILDVPPADQLTGTTQFAAGDDPAALGGDDEVQVYGQVRQRIRQVHGCYLRQRNLDPRLAGKLTVEMTIAPAPKGSVSEVKVVQRSIDSYEVEECVVATLQHFAFRRQGDTPLTVNLPFVFR